MTTQANHVVRKEWATRIAEEYREAAYASHFVLWLIQIGGPPELIREALGLVSDDLCHAELAKGIFEEAGGENVPPLDRDTLGLRQTPNLRLEADVLRVAIERFCLEGAVCTHLWRARVARCTEPKVRAALRRIADDAPKRQSFGWAVLEWLFSGPGEALLRAYAERELPGMLERLYAPYTLNPPDMPLDSAEASWGVLSVADRRVVLLEAIREDLEPGFEEIGIQVDLSLP